MFVWWPQPANGESTEWRLPPHVQSPFVRPHGELTIHFSFFARRLPGKMLNKHSRIPALIFLKCDLDVTKRHPLFQKSPIYLQQLAITMASWLQTSICSCKHPKIAGVFNSKWGNSQRFSWTSPARRQVSAAGLHRGACRNRDHHDARRPRQNMASSQNCHEMNGKYAKFNTSIDWSFNQIKWNKQETHTLWANKRLGL